MPIIITKEQDGSTKISGGSAIKQTTPKFFNRALTGSDKATTRGFFNTSTHTFKQNKQLAESLIDDYILDNALSKASLASLESTSSRTFSCVKDDEYELSQITPLKLIPSLYELSEDGFTQINIDKHSKIGNLNHIDDWTCIYQSQDASLYMTIQPERLIEFKSTNKASGKTNKFYTTKNSYNLLFVNGSLDDIKTFEYNEKIELRASDKIFLDGRLHTDTSKGIIVSEAFSHDLHKYISSGHHAKKLIISEIELAHDESMYLNIMNNAFNINNFRNDQIDEYFEIVSKETNPETVSRNLERFIRFFDHLDKKNKNEFTVDGVSNIYQKLTQFQTLLGTSAFENLLKINVRLMLAANISKLNNERANLYSPDTTTDKWKTIKQSWLQNKDYSYQQRRIITSEEPLIIAQAGAGSGKTHTVVGRLNYLKEQGEDLKNVLTLSFTNAAARVILKRFPNIQSETLARMFDNIYQANFPNQELVTIETLGNTLDLIDLKAPVFSQIKRDDNPNKTYSLDEVTKVFRQFKLIITQYNQSTLHFKKIDINTLTTTLMKTISENSTTIMTILSVIGQTTLEIEPIIIHHYLTRQIHSLTIPKEYQNIKYVITDESQDISTFEYTLLLEIVTINKTQFLIVGDGSQTLYEFRSSDPRYMNALEASGIFKTYKLDTNYRSKQAILTYANEFLKVIDANNIAQIQLQSNDKTPLTEDEFNNRVIVNDTYIKSSKEYLEGLEEKLQQPEVEEYIMSKIKSGEKVCFAAYTHAELRLANEYFQSLIKKYNLNTEVLSLSSPKSSNAAIWTASLVKVNKDLRKLYPSPNLQNDIFKNIMYGLKLAFGNRSDKQFDFFKSKLQESLNMLFASPGWKYQYANTLNRRIKTNQLIGYLYSEFIKIEKRELAAGNYLKANEEPDMTNVQFIISTIHAVKGFEFDNMIIPHDSFKTNRASGTKQQEIFRMLFVALSRAKNSELILNFSGDNKLIRYDTMLIHPMETAKYIVLNDLKQTQSINGNN